MAYQFLHLDTVARSVPKKAQSKRWGLSDTLAEAARLDGACPHIDAPKPPKRVYGVHMSVVQTAVESRANEACDAKGRKLRKDAPVLLAGVVSYPVSMVNLDGVHWAEYERWERKTLDWMASRFGDGLASVVRHTDETFPHLHFFVVPELAANGGLDLEAVHPGIAAREAAKRAGKDSKESNRAYCEAMRGLQNDFHQQVGLYYGHLREGPKRRRLSRRDYMAAQREAKQMGRILNKAEMDLTELSILKLSSAGADQAQERLISTEADNLQLRKVAEGFEKEVQQLSKRLEQELHAKKIFQKAVKHSATVILNLAALIVRRNVKHRSFLLSTSLPLGLNPEVWQRLRGFLLRNDDVSAPIERIIGQERKRPGDERLR